jgi:hypothetical protein
MNWFERFIVKSSVEIERPTLFSWFHIISILITTSVTVFFTILFRKRSDKAFRIILLIVWCIWIILEIYKQCQFSIDYYVETDTVTWKYSWFQFPFQFCSMPEYVGIISVIFWNFKLNYFLVCFLGLFGFFGGFSVYIYPETVFIRVLMIDIQSMIHHGLMVLIGVLFLVYKVKKVHRTMLYAIPVFLLCVIMAEILNVIVTNTLGKDTAFNMFSISPYFISFIPILQQIQTVSLKLFPLILFLYVVVFILLGYLVLLVAIIIQFIVNKAKEYIDAKKYANETNMGLFFHYFTF